MMPGSCSNLGGLPGPGTVSLKTGRSQPGREQPPGLLEQNVRRSRGPEGFGHGKNRGRRVEGGEGVGRGGVKEDLILGSSELVWGVQRSL